MTEQRTDVHDHVGPVLQTGVLSEAIIAAIRDLNQDVLVIDRGAYLRVLVPGRCVVTRQAIEKHLGRSVRFPGELETVMSGFKGLIQITHDDVVWHLRPIAKRS